MGTLHTKIAGFSIRFVFTPYNRYEDHPVSLIRQTFYGLLHRYVIPEEDQSPDFEIRILNSPKLNIINKSGIFYAEYYRYLNTKTLETYYQAGYHHIFLLIRHVLFSLVGKSGGFVLHASSNITPHGLVAFTGPSGAGKSTAMQLLSPHYHAFTDDMLLVRKIKEKYIAYQSPGIEKASWIFKRPEGYPIRALYLLRKTDIFSIKTAAVTNKALQAVLAQIATLEDTHADFSKNAMRFLTDAKTISTLSFAPNSEKLISLFIKKDVVDAQTL